MRFWLTVMVILAVFGFARRYGKGPEQQAAAILLANLVLVFTYVAWHGEVQFSAMDRVLALLDFGSLVGFLWIAVRANRIWPLAMAALQMVVMIAHLSVFIEVGARQAYWGMMVISQYLQLVVLATGLILHHRREKRAGPYRSWRPAFPA